MADSIVLIELNGSLLSQCVERVPDKAYATIMATTTNMLSSNCARSTLSWSVLGRTDTDIRQRVNDIVESTAQDRAQPDRRVDKRYAFPQLLTLTPISDRDDISQIGHPVHVVGKWLAERGLDFFHTDNMPFRRAIVSFEAQGGAEAHLILNISWSRFLRPGWYDSGGRFTHVVEPHEPGPSEGLFE